MSGKVVDFAGQPVAHAEIDIFSYAGFMGPMPTTQTNADGSFSLKVPPFGKGRISAFLTASGYPNASLALYNWKEYRSTAEITAAEGTEAKPVLLQFGKPDAVIDWSVRSRKTGQQITDGRYHIAPTDSSNLFVDLTMPSSGILFVIPKHRVTITITAPGCKDWSSAQIAGAKDGFTLAPGTRDKRTIYLDEVEAPHPATPGR